jgi:peptide chain release factor 2
MREKGGLERSLANYKGLETGFSDAETLLELGDEMGDPDTLLEAEQSLLALVPMVRDAEIEQMFGEKFDDANAILDINSGAGGTDAADWAAMLKRMYLGWAAHMHFKAVVVDEEAHEDAGIKSCRIEVSGPYAYGYLKSEIGVHRLVATPPSPPSTPSPTSTTTSKSTSRTATTARMCSVPAARVDSRSTPPTRRCGSPTSPPASWWSAAMSAARSRTTARRSRS